MIRIVGLWISLFTVWTMIFSGNSTTETEKNTTGIIAKKNSVAFDSAAFSVLDPSLLEIKFCGDTVPLQHTHIARKYQKAVQHYDYPAFTKNRAKYSSELKTITRILKKHGIPQDMKYIPLVESAFNTDVKSHRGAAGYWQFMPETARGLGLRVNDSLDQRKDLVLSTEAAARYMKWLYKELGNWTLAAAAFNVGPTRLIRHMGSQNKNDYYQLRMNSETSRYVYKLIAVREWMDNPARCEQWKKAGFVAKIDEFNKVQKLLDVNRLNASL